MREIDQIPIQIVDQCPNSVQYLFTLLTRRGIRTMGEDTLHYTSLKFWYKRAEIFFMVWIDVDENLASILLLGICLCVCVCQSMYPGTISILLSNWTNNGFFFRIFFCFCWLIATKSNSHTLTLTFRCLRSKFFKVFPNRKIKKGTKIYWKEEGGNQNEGRLSIPVLMCNNNNKHFLSPRKIGFIQIEFPSPSKYLAALSRNKQ